MRIPPDAIDLGGYLRLLDVVHCTEASGRVQRVVGLTIEAKGIDCKIGEICSIPLESGQRMLAEVVGFSGERAMLMPLGEMQGLQPGHPVLPLRRSFLVPVGRSLLGRILDGLGRPIDSGGPLYAEDERPTLNHAPHPLKRRPISEILVTGVRAIDGLLTCGKGQRMGIFSGSGVGKSTLLGTIARNASSEVSVVALIGERGREVQEFIERDLGEEGLERSVIVVSTSDQPPLVRIKAAWVAMTIAEWFRDAGMDVTFLMDSVTRFAMAQREIGLAIGEPPASKGYTPSVFALMPKLLERAGTSDRGTITGFFTVLVEGDDFNEPICDAARSILDGHIILTRELAARNHYPAIDILNSVSRVMPAITDEIHRQHAGRFRRLMASYERARDLINIGAYVQGSDPDIDAALEALPKIRRFLQQGQDFTPFGEMRQQLQAITAEGD